MDTIAAISTGNQITAIGVLRVSGPEALAAADRVFRPLDGRKLSDHPRRQMVLGALLDGGGADHRPVSGGDLCRRPQLHRGGQRRVPLPRLPGGACRGAPGPLRRRGPAGGPGGEFTKRAFLNGRMT